jgi:hypothetical protein
MKKIILVYGKNCIESEKALSLLKEINNVFNSDFIFVEFSFNEPVVKKYNIVITPTIIINDKITFIGTPDKNKLIKEIA